MSDEEFQKRVLEALSGLNGTIGGLSGRFDTLEGQVNARLDAIVARLDEQDHAHDVLVEKVDRLGSAVRDSLAASEQALTAVTALSRRVYRLEHPGGGRE